jgi:hypothetical protein
MAEAEYWRFTVARDCQKKNTSENHSLSRLSFNSMAQKEGLKLELKNQDRRTGSTMASKQAPKQVHSLANPRCLGKFFSEYKTKDKVARIFQYSARIWVVALRAKYAAWLAAHSAAWDSRVSAAAAYSGTGMGWQEWAGLGVGGNLDDAFSERQVKNGSPLAAQRRVLSSRGCVRTHSLARGCFRLFRWIGKLQGATNLSITGAWA